MKNLIFITVLLLMPLFSHAQSNAKLNSFGQDFMEFWTDIKDNYAYFDKKQTDWDKVKDIYLPQAQQAKDSWALITVFEQTLEELYDHHVSLNVNLQTSTRLVPSGLNVWAEWERGHAFIKDVRLGSSAYKSGARAGMEIISINNIPVTDAIESRVGKCLKVIDNNVRSFALRQLLAGNHLEKRSFIAKYKGKMINIDDSFDEVNNIPPLESKKLNDVGYIRINNSLGDNNLIRYFDSALLVLKDTKALILDLRDTPGGGNSLVARGIMSRFITVDQPYQKHELPNEDKQFGIKRSWMEIVSPRGPFTYTRKVYVLINHWTGSMGEGIAIGFDALKRGTIVGTPMAALNGAMSGFKTSRTNIPFSIPTEKLYHVNGVPREEFVPAVEIDLADEKYRYIDDPIFQEALKLAEAK